MTVTGQLNFVPDLFGALLKADLESTSVHGDILVYSYFKKRCQSKAKSYKPRLQGNMGNFQTMSASYSRDLRRRVIWMKEVLAYEVNEEAASLSLFPRTVERCR